MNFEYLDSFMYHIKMNAHTHVAAKDQRRAKERGEGVCMLYC